MPIVYPQNAVMYQTNVSAGEFNIELGLFNRFLDAIDGTYCSFSAYGETGDDPTIDGDVTHEDCGTFQPTSVISSSASWSEDHFPASYSKVALLLLLIHLPITSAFYACYSTLTDVALLLLNSANAMNG